MPGVFKTKALFTRSRKLSVGLFVCKGSWKVFGPITNGNFFRFESLNVEEMVSAANNRKSDPHISKLLS